MSEQPDIVERLRESARPHVQRGQAQAWVHPKVLTDAADEIERLRRENDGDTP